MSSNSISLSGEAERGGSKGRYSYAVNQRGCCTVYTVYVLLLIRKVTNTGWLQLVCVSVHKRCCSLERASLMLHSSLTTGAQFAANWMKNKN